SQFTISIGDSVSLGVPGPGAGEIESPGAEDDYTFSAVAGQIGRASCSESANQRIFWGLLDTDGRELFVDRLDGNSPGLITLTNGGAYTVQVVPEASFSGTYAFKILNVPPPSQFTISIGDSVSPGVPGSGAGEIESPGAEDDYTFSALAGQRIFAFDRSEERRVGKWVYLGAGRLMLIRNLVYRRN